MTVPPVHTAGARVWHCDDCGIRFAWTKHSYWYGSLKEVDEGDWKALTVHCGCRPMPVGELLR